MGRFKTFQDMFKRYRRPGDIVFSIVFLAFSLYLLSRLGDQTQWKKGTKLFAQPRFWPAVSLSFMVFFGAMHFFGSAISPRLEGRWREIGLWARALEYVVWFLIYVQAVPVIGYLLATVLFSGLLTFRLGYRGPKWLVISTVTGFLIVVVFKSFLQVKVPGGMIYEYLPDGLRSFMLVYF